MQPTNPDRQRACRRAGLLSACLALFPLAAVLYLSQDPRWQPDYAWLAGALVLCCAAALYRLGYRRAEWEYPAMPVSASLTPAAEADEDEEDELPDRLWPGPSDAVELEPDGRLKVIEGPDEGGAPQLMAMRFPSGWQLIEEPAEPEQPEPEPDDEPEPLSIEAYRELAWSLLAAAAEAKDDDPDYAEYHDIVFADEPLQNHLADELAPELRRFFDEVEHFTYGDDTIGRPFLSRCQLYPPRLAISSEMAFGEVYTVRPGEEGITVMGPDLEPTDTPDHPHIWQLICDWFGTEDDQKG